MRKKIIKSIIFTLCWLLFIVFFNSYNQAGTKFNIWYQNKFYPLISKILREISSLFPFSIGDIFYTIIISIGIFWLIKFIQNLHKKNFQLVAVFGLKLLHLTFVLYALFLFFWAGNYQRVSFAKQIQLQTDSLSEAKLHEITLLMIQKANETVDDWQKSNNQTNFNRLRNQAFRLFQKNSLTAYQVPSFKPSLFSTVMSKLGIMGYYQPFWAEGTLNKNIPTVDIPFIICHEMAHQKGIAYEDEAHLMAVWLIENYGNTTFQFSMYINMLDYLLPVYTYTNKNKYHELAQLIHPEILKILNIRKAYWQQQTGPMQNISSFLFDKLLKANKQEKGIHSYLGINQWLYALYLAQKK